MSEQKIKCVIWDLDNTIWDGILIEDKDVKLKQEAVETIKELDKRGILQSISSKNNFDDAKAKLEEFGIWEIFIYPKINWNSKSEAVGEIAKNINIGIDTLAFVDDQPFEREEVAFGHSEVLCIDSADISKITEMERMVPTFITSDSANRRNMYQTDIVRNEVEQEFTGTKEEFLKTLDMKLALRHAQVSDIQRMEELTVRTHQLNSTGYIYSYDDLTRLMESDEYELIVAGLDDKYGTYGMIGMALIKKEEKKWELELLLMSCRVVSKGVGNIFMNHIINTAREKGVRFTAKFVPSDRNRVMYITYKFNGFSEAGEKDGVTILEADLSYERKIPGYVTLDLEKGV